MSVSTKSYFSNAVPGAVNVGADADFYSTQANPKFQVGQKFERADGTIFRYAHFAQACNPSRVVAPDFNDNATMYTANSMIATSNTFQQNDETPGVYPGMVGSRYVVMQMGTLTAQELAGGYIGISSGTGLGYCYRIKGNAASNGTATVLNLYDKIQVGLDATSDIAIGCNKYANLREGLSITTQNAKPVGVTMVAITTDKPFGFILQKGITTIGQSGTLTNTKGFVILSDTDSGCVEALGNGAAASDTGTLLLAKLDVPIVGKLFLATATSGHALIDVDL